MTIERTQVLIVGGGPVGLSTALLLAKFGIKSIIVERNATTSAHPKASYFNTRTMEILRQIGVAEDVYAKGGLPTGVSFYTNLSGFRLGGFDHQDFPDYVSALMSGTASPGCISSQIVLESTFRDHAERNANVDLRFSHECTNVTVDENTVTADILDRKTGKAGKICADYIIACDGAHSKIRQQLGRVLVGPPTMAQMMNVYIKADLNAITHESGRALYWISNPNAPGVFVGLGGDWQHWCYLFSYEPAKGEKLEDFTAEHCLERIRIAMGNRDLPVEILAVGGWELCGQVIDKYREGRVLFAGDAAHLNIPAGGFGFNTGMQEAHNLAWKLAYVLKGLARDNLLDSYGAERREIAVYNVEVSRENAIKIGSTGAVMGTTIDDVDQIELENPEGQRQRGKLQQAIIEQKRHFLFLGQEIGFGYWDSPLVTPDGSLHYVEEYGISDPVYSYVPNARPGARAPHVVVTQPGSAGKQSIHDYLYRGFVCLTYGESPYRKDAIADRKLADLLTFYSVGDLNSDCDLIDCEGAFASQYGLNPGGAVLVRPDGHIAWRSANPSGLSELTTALARSLAHAEEMAEA